jgi:hypothetical protein
MTAAGLAFIAGGLATLISFRAMIFGGGARRATRAGASARRRRSRSTAPGPVALEPEPVRPVEPEPVRPVAESEPVVPLAEGRRGRRRRLAAAFSGRQADTDAGHGALASIGLADDEPFLEDEYAEFHEPEPEPDVEEEDRYEEPEPRPVVDRSDRAYGDRIDDWVRPHYRDLDDHLPAGDYWTPVPDGLYADPEPSASGYGWPVPVERLPPVPDYEPATGFDLTPVEASEPTTLVPTWPPAGEDRRIRLPRSWAKQDDKADEVPRHGRGDRARPRPRPRPAAQSEPGSAYVSRHAAGPHG